MIADGLENVRFLGKIPNRSLPLYYSAADVVIVPSLHEEAYGRVIPEALSCGTPVIASRRGGIPEALDESVGFLIEPTHEEMTQIIMYLYANRRILEEVGKSCRSYAEAHFGVKNVRPILDSYFLR